MICDLIPKTEFCFNTIYNFRFQTNFIPPSSKLHDPPDPIEYLQTPQSCLSIKFVTFFILDLIIRDRTAVQTIVLWSKWLGWNPTF